MQSGKLRHFITIVRSSTVKGETGEDLAQTPVRVTSTYAAVEPLSGREFFAANRTNNRVNHRVRMRYQTGITPAMHVLYGARALRIEAVLNTDERNRELVLMCEELS